MLGRSSLEQDRAQRLSSFIHLHESEVNVHVRFQLNRHCSTFGDPDCGMWIQKMDVLRLRSAAARILHMITLSRGERAPRICRDECMFKLGVVERGERLAHAVTLAGSKVEATHCELVHL